MSSKPVKRHHLCAKLNFWLEYMDKIVMLSLPAKAKQLFKLRGTKLVPPQELNIKTACSLSVLCVYDKMD